MAIIQQCSYWGVGDALGELYSVNSNQVMTHTSDLLNFHCFVEVSRKKKNTLERKGVYFS